MSTPSSRFWDKQWETPYITFIYNGATAGPRLARGIYFPSLIEQAIKAYLDKPGPLVTRLNDIPRLGDLLHIFKIVLVINTELDFRRSNRQNVIGTVWQYLGFRSSELIALQYHPGLFLKSLWHYVSIVTQGVPFVMYRLVLWPYFRSDMENGSVTLFPLAWTADMISWCSRHMAPRPIPRMPHILLRCKEAARRTRTAQRQLLSRVPRLRVTRHPVFRPPRRSRSSSSSGSRPITRPPPRLPTIPRPIYIVPPITTRRIPFQRPRITLPELHDEILYQIEDYLPFDARFALRFTCRAYYERLVVQPLSTILDSIPPGTFPNYSLPPVARKQDRQELMQCHAMRNKFFPLRQNPRFCWLVEMHLALERSMTAANRVDEQTHLICTGCGKVRALSHIEGRAWASPLLRLCPICIDVHIGQYYGAALGRGDRRYAALYSAQADGVARAAYVRADSEWTDGINSWLRTGFFSTLLRR